MPSSHTGNDDRSVQMPEPRHDQPETNDPVVLRELLRQAHEQLRLHRSFDQVIADNATRAEALLAEAGKLREQSVAPDTGEVRQSIDAIRQLLSAALEGIDRLERSLIPANCEESVVASPFTPHAEHADGNTKQPMDAQTHRIDVLIHPVTSPALARSAQQHLAAVDGITHAEVRELAEGLLRITVESKIPVTDETFATWEQDRPRSITTASDNVLEITLDEQSVRSGVQSG